jgi:hypothetical protein
MDVLKWQRMQRIIQNTSKSNTASEITEGPIKYNCRFHTLLNCKCVTAAECHIFRDSLTISGLKRQCFFSKSQRMIAQKLVTKVYQLHRQLGTIYYVCYLGYLYQDCKPAAYEAGNCI